MKNLQVLWRLICYRPILYSAATILWILNVLTPLPMGLLVQHYLNELARTQQLTSGLQRLNWLALALILGSGLCALSSGVLGRLLRFSVAQLLRRNLLQRVLEQPGASAFSHTLGETLSRFRSDVEQFDRAVDWSIDAVGHILFALLALIVLLKVSVLVTVLIYLPLAGVVATTQAMYARLQRFRKSSRQASGNVASALGEIFGTVQAIQLARAEQAVVEHVRTLNKRRRVAMLKDRVVEQLVNSTVGNITGLGTGFVLMLVAQSLHTFQLGIGDLALFLYYLPFVADFSKFTGTFMAHLAQTRISHQRLLAISQGMSEGKLVEYHPLYLSSSLPEPHLEQARPDNGLQELSATNLTYRYPESGRGIDGINLRVRRGSITVITGRVASGKTTLLRVLLGLLPREVGEISWNGQKVHDPASFFVPPRSAYTAQIPHLFSATLKENILLDQPETQEALQAAVHAAVMEQDVEMLEHGLETTVGARGVKLSGGQVQRAAAARMFARSADLLVFDDLSSALDVTTEQQLWERLLARQSEEHPLTCLLVSHRRSVLQRADHILVLNEGRVEASGTAADLLLTSSEFRAIWSSETEEASVHKGDTV
ncbi:ATP-binding cassette domain-containing protein [Ktedonobacter robiniae]|uniref:HlyB/MsbA family ABC transporter n=1 Tax=Ktedonobacter robiniae TaxID=2778365 RepID=A0ABQ3V3L2_9CHLR|nr:ABC transporter ATP-binding protein [Ktedonobacter robiniae]GHO59548.1 HlyB/MsbA family ABC transporter [Ktedonobacter robiniae]